MRDKLVYFISFILVVLTLLFNTSFVTRHKNIDADIEIRTKLISTNIEEGQNLTVDVEVKNNSNKSIYNVEILTEVSNKNYVQAYGNVTCKSIEELEANNKLFLRGVYTVKDEKNNSNEFEGYRVRHVNIFLIIICLVLYVSLVVLFLKSQVRYNKKLNILYLFLVIILSIVISLLNYRIKIKSKNESIINSYEDRVETTIAGKKEYIKVLVNYTTKGLESLIDKNNNDIADVVEREDFIRDSDGDGLPDFYELYMCETNPYMLDSHSTGLGDINYDTDNDGVSNLIELELNCNPMNKDTDYDGLTDFEELGLGTDPLKYDTDSDGMSDGFEVSQGYNPLLRDTNVVVTKELKSDVKEPKNRITASVEVDTVATNAESLKIATYETMLVNSDVPGYIGSAFDISFNGIFNSAVLNFEIDEYWLNKKGCEPCIYYFNEETQLLEELETIISGNRLSTTLQHFSVYLVLDRSEVNSWLYDDIFYDNLVKDIDNINIAFVLDNSHSMDELDADKKSHSFISSFIDKITEDNINISLSTFTTRTEILSNFTTNYELIKDKLFCIERDSGYESDSGTDIQEGITNTLDLFNNVDDSYNIMILLTDGDLVRMEIEKRKILDSLADKKVRLYCIDLGNQEDVSLKNLSLSSGGNYYLVGDVEDTLLNTIFDRLSLNIDSVLTGLTFGDMLYTDIDLLQSGYLRTGTGLQLFTDEMLDLFDISEDIDGDYLSNGKEIFIESVNGHVYLKIHSNPFEKDTDKDGIIDFEDEAPFIFGDKGGVVGDMYIAVEPTKVLGGLDSGHTWLVFESRCDITFLQKCVKEGYINVRLGDEIKYVTMHNLYPYTIKRNSYMSFGYYTNAFILKDTWSDAITTEEIGKILVTQRELLNEAHVWTQEEIEEAEKIGWSTYIEQRKELGNSMSDSLNGDFRINQEFKNLSTDINCYADSVGYKIEVTYEDLIRFIDSVDTRPIYKIYKYNCTNFAVDSWNVLCSNDADRIVYDTKVFGVPRLLYSYVKIKSGSTNNFSEVMLKDVKTMKPIYIYDNDGNYLGGE